MTKEQVKENIIKLIKDTFKDEKFYGEFINIEEYDIDKNIDLFLKNYGWEFLYPIREEHKYKTIFNSHVFENYKFTLETVNRYSITYLSNDDIQIKKDEMMQSCQIKEFIELAISHHSSPNLNYKLTIKKI